MKKRKIKEVKKILLTDIDIRYESMSRQSFANILRKYKPTEWHKIIAITEPLKELMDSMKATGQIECIGVDEIEVDKNLLAEDGREGVYFLIFGLRRFVAAYLLGWLRIRASVF